MPKILIDVPDDLCLELLSLRLEHQFGPSLEQNLLRYCRKGLEHRKAEDVAANPLDVRFSQLVEQIAKLPINTEFSVNWLTDGEGLNPNMKKMLGRRLSAYSRHPESCGAIQFSHKTVQNHSIYKRVEGSAECTQAK